MRVRTKLAFQAYSKGQVIETQPNVGRLWMQRGLCEEVVEPSPPVVECAAPVAVFARHDADEVPSATGELTEHKPQRKRHAR